MTWRLERINWLAIPAKFHYLYRALGFTLAALFLYVPANLYPFMTMKYGAKLQYTTIWDGIRSLFDSGMWVTASIVFMASVIIPIFKIISLIFIILAYRYDFAPVSRWSLLILVDFIGRWSMLDVFLVAIMVALVKFGSFATVQANISSYLFGFVVIFTMLGSANLRIHIRELGI